MIFYERTQTHTKYSIRGRLSQWAWGANEYTRGVMFCNFTRHHWRTVLLRYSINDSDFHKDKCIKEQPNFIVLIFESLCCMANQYPMNTTLSKREYSKTCLKWTYWGPRLLFALDRCLHTGQVYYTLTSKLRFWDKIFCPLQVGVCFRACPLQTGFTVFSLA